jgi:hypothetical protein
MVLDTKLFHPGYPLVPETFLVIEQALPPRPSATLTAWCHAHGHAFRALRTRQHDVHQSMQPRLAGRPSAPETTVPREAPREAAEPSAAQRGARFAARDGMNRAFRTAAVACRCAHVCRATAARRSGPANRPSSLRLSS